MTVLSRIQAQGETILDFTTAAEEKYLDGFELIVQNRYDSGIYLMGYAAEMWLKSACFYLREPNLDGTELVVSRLGPALDFAKTYLSLVPTKHSKDKHDLRFWAVLVRETRRWQNRPLPPALDTELMSLANRLYQNWSVEMRYRANSCDENEARVVLDDVSWLNTYYFDLRR